MLVISGEQATVGEQRQKQAFPDATAETKQLKSSFTYMSKPFNPPLTKEEIKKAKGDWVWRKVPYAELSEDEKKDPNFWIGIDPKTGQARSIINP